MSEREFALLTARELFHLSQRHALEQEREDYRTAAIQSAIANFSMALDRKRFPHGLSPSVFLGKDEPKKEQTDVEQLAIFDSIVRQAKKPLA